MVKIKLFVFIIKDCLLIFKLFVFSASSACPATAAATADGSACPVKCETNFTGVVSYHTDLVNP